jgi:hypothetical protein
MRYRFAFGMLAFALLVCAVAGFASASPASDAMATVTRFVDDFNTNNGPGALAQCASRTAIIDEFPPHTWQSCAAWASAEDAYDKAQGVTDTIVTLGTPWHVAVTGNVAYVVVPAVYTFKQRGKPMTENGSVFTLVLEKMTAGWRIVSWTWAKAR